jgi:plastocyanin
MRWRWLVVPVVIVFAVAACGASGAPKVPTTKDTIAGLQANDAGTRDVSVGGNVPITMQGNEYYFNPSVLKGTPGEHLTVQIQNVGGTAHNFTLKSQNIDDNIETGKTVTVNVTFPATGVLSFYCKFHRDKGMVGGLLTSGPASG